MFKGRRSKDDFAEEIKAHLELEADELKSQGMSEKEVQRQARLEFGNIPVWIQSPQAWKICLHRISPSPM